MYQALEIVKISKPSTTSHASVMNAVKSAAFAVARPNPGMWKKPSPLPLRPLRPNRFTVPRGQKQVFLYANVLIYPTSCLPLFKENPPIPRLYSN